MPIEIISYKAEEYAKKYTSEEDALLTRVDRETRESHSNAHMLSGHVQGRFLSFLSTMLQPKYILEIGTFTGYSALCLAEGLAHNGELHTIEIRKEDAEIALTNFKFVEKNKQLILHCGEAQRIIPTLPYQWDLVFIDADKVSYIEYYEMVLPQLSERGFIVADNVLFHGQVLEDTIEGKNARAIDEFNKHVANDLRVEQVMLTVRDGLLLIKKKQC
jgi:predicted O-methyltransferase YrrM